MAGKLDPRFLRTRKLIKDALKDLVIEKNFKDITIKEITERATVNRATFYYHFFDKYDLLERVLSEDLMQEVLKNLTSYQELTPKSLTNIFFSLLSFQTGLANRCSRSYAAITPKIETIAKEELGVVFKGLLKQQYPAWSNEKLELHSIMISWSLYGMLIQYVNNGSIPSEELMEEVFITLLHV